MNGRSTRSKIGDKSQQISKRRCMTRAAFKPKKQSKLLTKSNSIFQIQNKTQISPTLELMKTPTRSISVTIPQTQNGIELTKNIQNNGNFVQFASKLNKKNAPISSHFASTTPTHSTKHSMSTSLRIDSTTFGGSNDDSPSFNRKNVPQQRNLLNTPTIIPFSPTLQSCNQLTTISKRHLRTQAMITQITRELTTTITMNDTKTTLSPKKLHNKTTKLLPVTTSLLSTTKRNFSAPSPAEEATQGANLVQIQQAVNQWAHLNFRGMEFLRSGTVTDLDNAESCFNECANAMEQYPLLPYRSLSLANLASCLMRKGNYKEAIKIFQPLTQQLLLYKQISISQIATIHMELASAYELSGQHDLSVKELYVASSRFAHAAAHFLGQIQGSDQSHFQLSQQFDLNSASLQEQEDAVLKTKQLLHETLKNPSQNDILREDQRAIAYSNAIESWRTALGCRYSAIVLQHRMANLDFALTELKKLTSVYKYVLDCVEVVQRVRWDCGEGELGDVSTITNEKGEAVDIDKTLKPHPQGAKMLQSYPLCPPEAKVVTSDLTKLFPDISLHHLHELYGRVTVEYVSILHSLANVYIDQGDFENVCATLQHSVDTMNPMDEEAFLKVASEGSKTLRLLYERLLLEQQNYLPGEDDKPCIIQVSDQAKVKFENKKSIEKTIKLLNTTRANILALFTTYIQGHMLNTTAPIEKEMFGSGTPAKIQQRVQEEVNRLSSAGSHPDQSNLSSAAPISSSSSSSPSSPSSSSYQSSASSSTINLDDLPPDAQQFFNFSRDQMKREFESGQFYERIRDVYKRELGPQFHEDLPELLKLKPKGYKAFHERDHLGDVSINDDKKSRSSANNAKH
jgi:tetratricopeptide (TPR) repeat protein